MPKNNSNSIIVKGARVHNLKNVNVEIPRDQFVVITGLSGSGKSSLAFDTIYAEGQRRYVESLSAYARQFLGVMNKPDVDSIEGLSPAISIDQKTAPHNPRSTVGTVTEIYDYVRLLYARIGIPHCPKCGDKIKPYTIDEIKELIYKEFDGKDIIILAPIINNKKNNHKNIINEMENLGFGQIRFDNKIYDLNEFYSLNIDNNKKHSLEIVVNKLGCTTDKEDKIRLSKSIEKALDLGNGLIKIIIINTKTNKTPKEKLFSKYFACPKCGITLPKLEPRHFSFNSPHGACPKCSGLGTKLEVDPKLIINKNLTIAQGGIKPWSHNQSISQTGLMQILEKVAIEYDFNLNTPIKNLDKNQIKIVLYGTNKKNCNLEYDNKKFPNSSEITFDGVIPSLEKRYNQTESDYVRKEIEKYMRVLKCPECDGKRLKKEILSVKVLNSSIDEVTNKTINETKKFFNRFKESKELSNKDKKISNQIIEEIDIRLEFLLNVGLSYLTLNRAANTLSGGEAQRIRLANQIGTKLVGVLYILDEPSIGLHQRDNIKLIKTLKKLRDIGNSVIVVEHDQETMEAADYLIDVGPAAGLHGGEIIAAGTPTQIKKNKKSITGQYMSGNKSILCPEKYRLGNKQAIEIIGAEEHNLKNINVKIPLAKFVCITGVSGSGKSTLITNILGKALSKKFHRAKAEPGKHKKIEGLKYINKVINIDQSPIGRTPRSNPVTYTGAFTPIRELFASLPEAKIKGFKAGKFSFNVIGGRCEACSGDGMIKIEMQFLPDVYIECDVCKGTRYNKETLDIFYKGKNISEVLNMTIEESAEFFKDIPAIHTKLNTLNEVGLGYVKLGQSATTLSGGEAQRVKLATELARKQTGKTLYILDEPTTGLHFDDIKRLLKVLNKLVDKGNTVLIIEHNLDVIKSTDWIIDIGPEGGDKGGFIVAEGTPKDIIKIKNSYTGKYLKKLIK
ncbi:excinuclease ABC subunit UvrA [Candidatus Parcubacteria bacterium]|nr:excinuclease ABC subunit UvrA [Candidatus Parcubacteria bacterium]